LLITFAIVGTKINVDADELSSLDGELPSVCVLGYNYPSLIKNENKELENEEINEIQEEIISYNLEYYLETNMDTIQFFAKMFGYNLEDVIYNLKEREDNNDVFVSTNIGYLKDSDGNLKIYDNFEYGLIEFFYDLNENYSNLRHQTYEPYEGNADYIEKLIIYYSNIYTNVDMTTLLSIGAAESGYYEVKYMLKYNNIYGGMSSKGLIKHNNIELGVLTYVKMMSQNYYAKGLNDIYSIGKIYCPVIKDGQKQASPNWINLVEKANEKYQNYQNDITINDLTNSAVIL
jgi:hypothetical protein